MELFESGPAEPVSQRMPAWSGLRGAWRPGRESSLNLLNVFAEQLVGETLS